MKKKWRLENAVCIHCGKPVTNIALGKEENQFELTFECGRVAGMNPFAEGPGKYERKPCPMEDK